MFAEDYLQMEMKTIKKKREKRMQAAKAEKAAQNGWCLKSMFHFVCGY